MKYPTLILLISISSCIYGQVESVELLPEFINDSTTNILSPSMNGLENRLCYKKTLGTKDAIMISDKSTDGKWSEPYVAIQFGEEDVFQSCTLSGDGNRIYFGHENDIFWIDYASDKKWSKPQLVKSPISDEETLEDWVSISRDNQTLTFLRNLRTQDEDSPWQLTPFMSHWESGKWSTPKKITINGLKLTDEVYVFQFTSENKICFYAAGYSQSDWGNYYGRLDKNDLLSGTKIDFKDGYIMWVNKDYTTGLIITATQPTRIATIKFTKPFTAQLLNLK